MKTKNHGSLAIDHDVDSQEPNLDAENSDNQVELDEDPEQSTSKENYFYVGSENIVLTDDIEGDVFICTSGSVKIDSEISGNVFVCASSVTISENGYIGASLFNVSRQLEISGFLSNNAYTVSQSLNVKGTIVNDLFATAEASNIDGKIERNSYVFDSSKTDTRAVSIADTIKSIVYSIISLIILAVVLFFICNKQKCRFIEEHQNFLKNLPKYLLWGLITLIVTPIVAIFLLILGVTANLSFILIMLYTILIMVSSSIVVISASLLCVDKIQFNINKTLLKVILIAAFCIIYKLLQLIPTLGGIITFLVVLSGMGLLIKTTFLKNKDVTI